MGWEGLSLAQVEERKANHEDNCPVEPATGTVAGIVKKNVCTYFNFIFLVLAVLLVLVGAYRDLFFILIVVSNTVIGVVQEIHSKRVLDRMAQFAMPKVQVIRDGRKQQAASEELVRGDVVIFGAGSRIPADAVVLDGTVKVNESLLTGESDEVERKPGDALLSGSFVVSGHASCELTAVGKNSYLSKLTLEATKTKEGEQSEMIRSLNKLIVFMGIVILPIGVLLFVQSFVIHHGTFYESVTGMVAAVLGMIPEGLYLLASVALAVSTARLAKKKVLVHDMKCIETLARVDILCVDKTGTITEPGMEVESVICLNGGEQELAARLSFFAGVMPGDNETMAALKKYFDGKERENGTFTASKVKRVCPFSSKYKYSGVETDRGAYVLGAPDVLLKDKMAEYDGQIGGILRAGGRVLVFGRYGGGLPDGALSGGVEPEAFLVFSNRLREGAKETFSYFRGNGVSVCVLSGDNPAAVAAVAAKAGLEGAERYVDASTLVTEREIKEAVKKYVVFGRVTPEQKRMIVEALKEERHTVAMVGDGVNDVLALKTADCGIAMASGSDAASQVAKLVLIDSDFSRMPHVVSEGRRVVNNIERTASLYIVKNIFSMLLAVFSVVLAWDYPIVPSQVSLISLFTIGIPSFLLALEPNERKIRGHFLVNVFVRALPAGLTDFITVGGLVIFAREFAIAKDCLATASTVVLAIVGFVILKKTAVPFNAFHKALLVSLVAAWLISMFLFGGFFAITRLSKRCAMFMALFIALTEPVYRYLEKGVVMAKAYYRKWMGRG